MKKQVLLFFFVMWRNIIRVCPTSCRKRLEHYQPFFRRSDYRLFGK